MLEEYERAVQIGERLKNCRLATAALLDAASPSRTQRPRLQALQRQLDLLAEEWAKIIESRGAQTLSALAQSLDQIEDELPGTWH